MSDNLGFGRIPEQIEQPEIAANDAFGAIDSFFSGSLDIDLTSDMTLTVAQSQAALLVRVKKCKTDGRLLTLPATRRLYFFDLSDASNTQSLTIAKGSKSIKLPIGVKSDVYSDGDANGLTLIASGGTGSGGGTSPGGGSAAKVVQVALDDDIYGNMIFSTPPKEGNLILMFYNVYAQMYDPGTPPWTVLKVMYGAAIDCIGVAYRVAGANETTSVPGYSTPRTEGAIAMFEVSGVSSADIDKFDTILESATPTVTATFTPTGGSSLVVGMVCPSGDSGFYPSAFAGADIIATFASQGDRDGQTSGRAPAAFAKAFDGTADHTLTATYPAGNTRALNLAYVSFKTAAASNAPIPDPSTADNGKFLGVAAGKYALVAPPSGGGGGGGDSYRAPVSIFASVQNTQIGNSPTIRYSRGVSSMIKRSDGVYRITFGTPFTDNYYVFEGGCRHEQDGGSLVDAHLSIDRRSSPNSGKNPEWIDVVATYQGAGIYDPKILEIWLRCMPNDYY